MANGNASKAEEKTEENAGAPVKAPKHADDIWAATYFCLLVIVLAWIAPALCLLLFIGLLPTIIIYFIDQTGSRSLSFTVGIMNLAAVLPFALATLRGNLGFMEVARLLAGPNTLTITYGAAATGGFLAVAAPAVARAIIEASTAEKRRRLEALAQQLREGWDMEDELAKQAREAQEAAAPQNREKQPAPPPSPPTSMQKAP